MTNQNPLVRLCNNYSVVSDLWMARFDRNSLSYIENAKRFFDTQDMQKTASD
jgi:hypothetical protein